MFQTWLLCLHIGAAYVFMYFVFLFIDFLSYILYALNFLYIYNHIIRIDLFVCVRVNLPETGIQAVFSPAPSKDWKKGKDFETCQAEGIESFPTIKYYYGKKEPSPWNWEHLKTLQINSENS